MVTGKATRCRIGKSTWTLRHCAWKRAKRSVMVWKRCRTASRWSRPFAQAEVAQIVRAELEAQEAGELLILPQQSVLPVGAEDVMAVLDLLDHGAEFSGPPFMEPDAEDLADPVGGQAPESNLAAAFEGFVDGEVALENL